MVKRFDVLRKEHCVIDITMIRKVCLFNSMQETNRKQSNRGLANTKSCMSTKLTDIFLKCQSYYAKCNPHLQACRDMDPDMPS